jgi:hypothetical protein
MHENIGKGPLQSAAAPKDIISDQNESPLRTEEAS